MEVNACSAAAWNARDTFARPTRSAATAYITRSSAASCAACVPEFIKLRCDITGRRSRCAWKRMSGRCLRQRSLMNSEIYFAAQHDALKRRSG
jgi:hypothetical protein